MVPKRFNITTLHEYSESLYTADNNRLRIYFSAYFCESQNNLHKRLALVFFAYFFIRVKENHLLTAHFIMKMSEEKTVQSKDNNSGLCEFYCFQPVS